jgi:hypothetical protein
MNLYSKNYHGDNRISTALLFAVKTSSHINTSLSNTSYEYPKPSIEKSILDEYVVLTKTKKEWTL